MAINPGAQHSELIMVTRSNNDPRQQHNTPLTTLTPPLTTPAPATAAGAMETGGAAGRDRSRSRSSESLLTDLTPSPDKDKTQRVQKALPPRRASKKRAGSATSGPVRSTSMPERHKNGVPALRRTAHDAGHKKACPPPHGHVMNPGHKRQTFYNPHTMYQGQ